MTNLAKASLGKGSHLTLRDYLHEELAQEGLYEVKTTISSSRVKLCQFMPMERTLISFLLPSLLRWEYTCPPLIAGTVCFKPVDRRVGS